jgi:hypothetical protein
MDSANRRTSALLLNKLAPCREACFKFQSSFNAFSGIFRAELVALFAAELVFVQNECFSIELLKLYQWTPAFTNDLFYGKLSPGGFLLHRNACLRAGVIVAFHP